jgi:eukaryotic-like serine/threonine-protein kinase
MTVTRDTGKFVADPDVVDSVTCPKCGTAMEVSPILKAAGIVYCPTCGDSLASYARTGVSSALPAGTIVGSYRILEVVGEGGMGRVYVAEHVKLGRRVAVKMLRDELASNPTAVSRFFAEARAVNRISHENIVEVTDFIEKPGGHNCLIMELLRGESLGRRLLRDGAMMPAIALEIAAQIASALSAVHAANIIHRDLKPDNIFIIERAGQPNFVKLLDFGVAKLVDAPVAVSTHSTAQGQIIGTPEYMSPEQAAGRLVDRRTDIYSLGIILYEMVTGTLPFRATNFGELVIKHMTVAPVRPSAQPRIDYDIPEALDELILDLLAKEPADRPLSMTEVGVRIHDMLDEMDLPMLPRHAMTSGAMRVARMDTGPIRRPTTGDRAKPAVEPKADTLLAAESSPSLPAASLPIASPRGRRWPFVIAGVAAVALAVTAWFVLRDDGSHETSAALPVIAAPKPPPAPPAPPAPPPPVTIRFTSTPAGAEVRLAGTTEVLGTTPCSVQLPRADRMATFDVSKPGYESVAQELGLAADGTVITALVAKPVAAAKPDKPKSVKPKPVKPKPVDRGGTMDVFGSH